MKIFSGFFVDQSKRLMALGVIVLILLTSAFGVVSGYESGGGCIAYLDADPDSITADGKSTSIMYFKAWCPGKYRFSAVPSIGTIKLEFPQIVPGRPSYATYTAPTTQELGDYKGVTITFYLKDDKDPNVIIESKSVTISLVPEEAVENCENYCKEKFDKEQPAFMRLFNSRGEYPFCICECIDERTGESVLCWGKDWNCEEYCSKKYKHRIWDGIGDWPDCDGCICEKGYEPGPIKKEECVDCETICNKKDSRAHYDSAKSKPNICACKCEDPYFWDESKEECIKCPPNSKPTGTSPCVERVRRECCCDNGYVASLDGLECLHFTNDAKIDHTLKNAPTKGKQHFVEMPNGKQIKVTVIQQPKRGWDNVFSGVTHGPAEAKKTFSKHVLNPRELDEPDSKYNCGGHVFGGRQMWIYPRQFPVILTEDNNYRMVGRTEIKEGDVAIYYTEDGNPMHVGKIIKATDGSLKVESKFSKWPLCEHEIDNVVNAMKIKFFRRFK